MKTINIRCSGSQPQVRHVEEEYRNYTMWEFKTYKVPVFLVPIAVIILRFLYDYIEVGCEDDKSFISVLEEDGTQWEEER